MKIEPPMFSQIVECMDQLLEVYKFNLNAADCTPFNGSIIKGALSSKIAQLNSLRQLFIYKYNSISVEDDFRTVTSICQKCGKKFHANMLFDEKGVSINDVPKLCDKCIVEVKK